MNKKRNYLFPLLVAALTACGGGESPAPGAMAQIPNPTLVIEMYGDSTTQGIGAPASESEPAWLQTMVPAGVLVSNQGVSATTAAQLLAGHDGVHLSFTQVMDKSSADIVTLNFGMNDLGTATPEEFSRTLGELIDIATTAGKRVVLQEPNPSCEPDHATRLPTYVAVVDAVAQDKGIPVVKQFGAYADWESHMSSAPPPCLHPDGFYYKIKAQNTWSTIEGLVHSAIEGT